MDKPCTNKECGFFSTAGNYWLNCIHSNAGPESRHLNCEGYRLAAGQEDEIADKGMRSDEH